METPEEFAREVGCEVGWNAAEDWTCHTHETAWREEDAWCPVTADLIRARDAEVRADERAKALAGFTEERKDRRSCGCQVPVNAVWSCCFSVGHTVTTERRLVGPWEPTPDD